jgi:hypothetical protein
VFPETRSEQEADIRHDGSLWIPGLALDYSLSMPRIYLGKDQLEQISMQKDDNPLQTFSIPQADAVAKRIAHLSGFVYLKMGDLLLLELHKPVAAEPGTQIKVLPEVDFYIR